MNIDYLKQLFSLEGKVAVVLGGTSGIGQAIARGYHKAGAEVVVSSRDQAKVDATSEELGQSVRVTTDVHDGATVQKLFDAVMAKYGKVDALVVTSGMLKKSPSVDLSDEDFARVVDSNLNGTFRANKVFGRQMIAQGHGSIINTCSMTTFVSFNEVAAYASGKSGVGGLVRSLACEWAKHNVRVNAIAPGVFRTPLNSAALDIPERAAAILGRTPMGRFGQLEELVGLAIYLAADASAFVTGQIVAVDGGFLAKGI